MPQRLRASFYQRSEIEEIARELLGKVLCTHLDGVLTSAMIIETEAYQAPDDKASHAYGNKKTKRTEVMFRSGGHAYIYLCYGIHHMMNVVSGGKGEAHAILIRAVQPVVGIQTMLQRRQMTRVEPRLTSGPGSLCQAMGIKTTDTGINMLDSNSSIWIEDHGIEIAAKQIIAGPRIGIDYAEECAAWPWRYFVDQNPWVSKPR